MAEVKYTLVLIRLSPPYHTALQHDAAVLSSHVFPKSSLACESDCCVRLASGLHNITFEVDPALSRAQTRPVQSQSENPHIRSLLILDARVQARRV
eukprot:14841-Heterococcus_DN1.PRE.2